ncbi:response regulator transcription factor [Mollicutes bacterium LVI A0039]|nr:response regulator transcription factor [Mollicutes bacterium LVI A0039]
MGKSKILVIDDSKKICMLIQEYGEAKYGYEVDTVGSIDAAIEKMKSTVYHLITLDIELEDENGLESVDRIKSNFSGPIIFVSCINSIETIIAGLQAGGDDYITKPFDLEELYLRINRSLSRRNISNKIEIENYEIDEIRNVIWLDGRELKLSDVAKKILTLLLKEKDTIIAREDIYTKVWGNDFTYNYRLIDTHISLIRKETGDARLCAKRSKGYVFDTTK